MPSQPEDIPRGHVDPYATARAYGYDPGEHTDPPPLGLVDRIRQQLAERLPEHIYPAKSPEAAASIDTELRRHIGQDLGLPPEMITLHIHQHDLDQPCPAWCVHAGTEHDTAQENTMTDSPSHDIAGGEIGGPPTLAERAAAASANPAFPPTAAERQVAGAYARAVLTEQLEAAREARDATMDMMEVYQEQHGAECLRVRQLELALEDLGDVGKGGER